MPDVCLLATAAGRWKAFFIIILRLHPLGVTLSGYHRIYDEIVFDTFAVLETYPMRGRFLNGMQIFVGVLLLTASTAKSQEISAGIVIPDLAGFDRLMSSFIKQNGLPGAELAVSHNGRIVYNRSFGYADRDKKIPVQPTSLFRIGSISKTITAVAVLQLVEKNKLKLDDKVFDVLKLEEPQGIPFDKRWKAVTILELLQHTGGWDSGKSFDPTGPWPTISKEMHLKSPGDHAGIIQYMLRKPLQFDPGTQHQYSNFGYCLLGRTIEKISGSSYEGYVKTHVLAPLGIKRMRLGKTSLKDRA